MVFAVALALVASRGTCQFLLQRDVAKSDIVDKVQSAEIDWGNECYYATGEADVPSAAEEPNRSRALLKAKGSAKTKAISNLMLAVENTPISNKAIGKDYISKDPQLQQAIERCIANAEVTDEKLRTEGDNTIVAVSVKLPFYGNDCAGSAILHSKFLYASTHELPKANPTVEKRNDLKVSVTIQDVKGPFTSVIIDCTGLDMQRAMNPKIRKIDGTKIWGSLSSEYDLPANRGVVAYVQSIEEGKRSGKAGSNPLIVRAAGRAGSRFMCDAAVSDQDADLLIKENESTKFLDKVCVILVVDAK